MIGNFDALTFIESTKPLYEILAPLIIIKFSLKEIFVMPQGFDNVHG